MTKLIKKGTHALYEISKLNEIKTQKREFKDEVKKQTQGACQSHKSREPNYTGKKRECFMTDNDLGMSLFQWC